MSDILHYSDCALHNPPASEAGPCDCGAIFIAELCDRLGSQTGPLNHATSGAMMDALDACGLTLVKRDAA